MIIYLAGNYMFKVNNKNARTRCEICSKLTINTPARRHWHCSGVFIINFEHISLPVLVFLLLTLSKKMPAVYRSFSEPVDTCTIKARFFVNAHLTRHFLAFKVLCECTFDKTLSSF